MGAAGSSGFQVSFGMDSADVNEGLVGGNSCSLGLDWVRATVALQLGDVGLCGWDAVVKGDNCLWIEAANCDFKSCILDVSILL